MAMSDFDPVEKYAKGFIGCRKDPRADEVFADYVLRYGGDPNGANVAYDWGLEQAGAGRLSTLWRTIEAVFPGSLPGPSQLWGDCFPAGTTVRMADGTEKPIEAVAVGESVVTHNGNVRRVLNTLKKPYKGDLVKLRARGVPRSVRSTPDHRFVCGNDDNPFWCQSELITKGTDVLIPRHAEIGDEIVIDLAEAPRAIAFGQADPRNVKPTAEHRLRWLHGKKEINRYAPLDFRLAWLIGLFLAEGSCDYGKYGPSRITFNLGSHEAFLAETAVQFINDIFGLDARIVRVPSKPSVVYVRFNCGPVAWLFKKLAPGNTYTKRVNRVFLTAKKSVRLGLLRGWFAGDGNLKQVAKGAFAFKTGKPAKSNVFSACAVSVSSGLVRDMFDIANSCGAVASVSTRPAYKQSKSADVLHLFGDNAIAAFPAAKTERGLGVSTGKKAGKWGMWKKVAETTREAFEGDVYCLEVEEDHSFIANGYAVHNCVGWGCSRALLGSLSAEIYDNKPDEVTGRLEGAPELPEAGIRESVIASESLFAWRNFAGDGWVCSEAAKVACEKGFLIRKPYPDLKIDLTHYTEKTIRLGGATPPGENWLRESKQYVARTATFLKGREQIRDFLAAGFGCFVCSSLGFDRTRNEDGVSRQIGVWHHSMGLAGFDDRPETHRKYGQGLVLVVNSWAKWNSGSRKVLGTDLLIPEGCFWALADNLDRCQCIALSSVAGWPRRKHTTYGAEGNV
jgi:hypothetical protein